MAVQKQDDQHEHTFSSYVRIRDVVLKTCLGRWTIGGSGERGSGISVLPARHDDDDIYIYIYIVPSISFQTFFVDAFKIVVDYSKFSMLLLYILWGDWQIFMISRSNEQLQRKLDYALRKPDCHSWWISKMQSGCEEERYAIKFCFKLWKNVTETNGMIQTAFRASCMNRASVFQWHKRFKEARESVRDDERCGRSKEVNTPQLIGQRVRVRVTMLRF